MVRRPPLALTALLLARAALAQEPPADAAPPAATPPPAEVAAVDSAQEGRGALGVIVVAPARGPRPDLDVPASVYRLEEEELRLRHSERSFPALLRWVPGVHPQETAAGQGSPFLRGLTGYHVLTLVDGVRRNGTYFRSGPNQYLSGIDPLTIGSVEVVRGQGAVLYGSDAIGGVLAVRTRDPVPPKDLTPGAAWLRPGAYLRWAQPLRQGGEAALTPRLEVMGGVGDTAVIGGFDVVHVGDRETGEHMKTARGTAYSGANGDLKLIQRLSEQEVLTLAFQRSELRNVPRTHSTIHAEPWRGLAVGGDLRRDLDQSHQLIYARLESEERGIFDRVAANVSLQREYEQEVRDRSSGRTRTGFEVWTVGTTVEAESDLPLPVDTTLSYGLDYSHEFVDSFQTDRGARRPRGAIADDADYDMFGSYLQLELRLGRVDVWVGGRYSLARVYARDVDPDPSDVYSFGRLVETYDALVGSTGLVLHLTDQLSLVGSAAQGFRAPNLSDTTAFEPVRSSSFDSPSPDLDPERSLTLELGLKWDWRCFRGQLFYAYTFLEDFIARVATGRQIDGRDEFIKRNLSRGAVEAIDGSAELVLHPLLEVLGLEGAPDLGLSFLARFAWTRGRLDALDAATGRRFTDHLDKAPPTVFGAIIRWTEPGSGWIWAEVEAEVVRRQTRLSQGDQSDTQRIPPGGTPGYTLWHARVGFNLFEERLRATLGLENIFDQDYRVHGSGTNGYGRTFLCNIQLLW